MTTPAGRPQKRVFEFDSFILDEAERSLRLSGDRLPLTPKAFEILAVLVANAGAVLDKEELMQRVWPDTFVEESNVAVNISTLRKALGEMPGGGQYIETVPRRGYRFAAAVKMSLVSSAQFNVIGSSDLSAGGPTQEATNAEPVFEVESKQPAVPSVARTLVRYIARHQFSVIALISIAFVSAVTYLVFNERAARRDSTQVRRLAVLPFRNQRPSEETDYLGFALADSVINRLDFLKALVVRPSSYVQRYANQKKDARDIASELDVDTLLTGTYLKDGEDVVVNAELADVKTGKKLWSESIRKKSDRLAELQDYVARQVVAGLSLNLTDAEGKRLERSSSGDPVAYEYFLRSQYLLSTSSHQQAIQLLERSVELDPSNALAWAFLARAYHINALQFSGDRAELSRAEADYEKALSIDPGLSRARLMMAKLYTETGRVEQAVPLLLEMIKAEPNNAEAHWELSYAYRYAGLLEDSIEEGERALQLNGALESHQFNTYLYAGQYEKFLSTLPVREDSYVMFYRGLGRYCLKDLNGAASEFDRAYELNRESVVAQIGKALRLAIAGRNGDAAEMLKLAEAKIMKPGVGDGEITYKFAQAYDAVGEKKAALRALSLSVEQGFFCHPYFANDPLLRTIRAEPEYALILERARQRQQAFRHKVLGR